MEKLKPCPFCGGEASLFTTDEIGYLGSDRFTTKCNGCFCGTGHYAGPERAIEAWNRRPAPENKALTCTGCFYEGLDAGAMCVYCGRHYEDRYEAGKPEEE